MKLPSLIGAASLSVLCLGTARADAAAPVDPARRSEAFAPAPSVAPDRQSPSINPAVQNAKMEKITLEKQPALMGDRRAPLDVQEARAKSIRERNSSRPAALEQPVSAFAHRVAPLATAGDTTKPTMVAKYQDSLKAASVANMAQYPAIHPATTAKFNRFVFRKNSPDPAPVTGGAPITPAAGGSAVRK